MTGFWLKPSKDECSRLELLFRCLGREAKWKPDLTNHVLLCFLESLLKKGKKF